MKIWNNELQSLADGIIYNLLTLPREKLEVNLDLRKNENVFISIQLIAVGAKMTSILKPLARNPQTKTCN